MNKIDFEAKEFQSALLEWHENLDQDRGARARLRRDSVETITYNQDFHNFIHSLNIKTDSISVMDRKTLELVCLVLVHVRRNTEKDFGSWMAENELKPLRFRRLMERDNRRDLAPALIRILPMVKNTANLIQLTKIIVYWGESIRRDLAANYYSELNKK